MKTNEYYIKVTTVLFLFLIGILTTPEIAMSDESSTPGDMVMVPGGPFLMGVDKEVNEKVKKSLNMRYPVKHFMMKGLRIM
jgi:formylglycine-generating enzyme required for sulfatase activity